MVLVSLSSADRPGSDCRDSWLSPCRVEREIQKLRQRISEGEENARSQTAVNDEKSSPVSHIQSLNTLLPLSDDRYAAETYLLRACSTSAFALLILCADHLRLHCSPG